jgi:hypothetical protein
VRLTSTIFAAAVVILFVGPDLRAQQPADPPPVARVENDASRSADAAILRAVRTARPPAAPPTAVAIPASLPADQPVALNALVRNRAAEVTIHAIARQSEFAGIKPPPGGSLLVVRATFENRIPLTLVEEKQVATEYRIPNLADHLYVVVDGQRVARLSPDAGKLPGAIPVADFRLDRFGARVTGSLVFVLPPACGEPKPLVLRFYV